MRFVAAQLDRCRSMSGEAVKFAIVGFLAFVVNAGLFNVLRPHWAPIRSNVAATLIAIVVAYVGNRYWVYRDRKNSASSLSPRREALLFVVSNLIAAAIQWGCLGLSHYGFGFTSALADNVSSYCFGMVLGTLFRFYTYRTWIFPPEKDGASEDLDLETARWESERTPA